MSFSWDQGREQVLEKPRGLGWALMAVRTMGVAITIFGLMVPLFVARGLGFKRLGQRIVQLACRLSLLILGLRLRVRGEPMRHAGGVVANHSSWLDIFVLNAIKRVYFVSKSDVSRWPLIGIIARSTGTVFIERRALDAARQRTVFQDHIAQGHKLLFFPEGTSTDGRRVLPFRSSLFAAFFDDLGADLWIQPVTVHYHAPDGARSDLYGWWGNMDFAGHFVMVASRFRQGYVEVSLHDPMRIADFEDRKSLAVETENAVRSGLRIN